MPSSAAIQPVADLDDRIVDNLPAPVAARLWDLTTHRDDAQARLRSSFDRMQDLRDQRTAAKRELAELEQAADRGRLFRERREVADDETGAETIVREPDEARLSAARLRVEQLSERYERERAAHDEIAGQLRAYGSATNRCERYLADHPRPRPMPPAERPPLLPGETAAAAVARVRERMSALRREWRTVASGPGTIDEAKALMRREVDKLSAEGEPSVAPLFAAQRPRIDWPMWGIPNFDVGGHVVRKVNGAALLAAMLRDELVAWLDARIDEHGAALVETLSAEARAQRLSEIVGEQLRLGYDEAALIVLAAETGHAIAPRADADVRCLLGLDPDSPARPDRRMDETCFAVPPPASASAGPSLPVSSPCPGRGGSSNPQETEP